MVKITFVTVSAVALEALVNVGSKINSEFPKALELKLYYANGKLPKERLKQMVFDIKTCDLVFVDLMGSDPSTITNVYLGLEGFEGCVVPYGSVARENLRLGSLRADGMKQKDESKKMDMKSIEKMRAMSEQLGKVIPGKMKDMRNYSLIMKYFKVADYENIKNMLYLMLRDYGGNKNLPEPREPREVEEIGIINTETREYYNTVSNYHEVNGFNIEKQTVAMLFYGHTYPIDTSKPINKIRKRLEEHANVLPIAISGGFSNNKERLREIFKQVPKGVDLILNFMPFRLGAGPMGGNAEEAIEMLKEINVPYLHPYFMSKKTEREWLESTQGASRAEVMITMLLSELDGAIELFPVGAMDEHLYNDEFKTTISELKLIEERADTLIKRILKQLELRKKQNKDKRIAIICYNYPPGEGNIFGGAFLDTFGSVEEILKVLSKEGYSLNPLTSEQLMERFTAGGLLNSGAYGDISHEIIRYPSKKYKSVFEKTKEYLNVKKDWGEAPGSIMSDDDDFLIPAIIEQNVFIGLQPTRGVHEEIEKIYHDKELSPHHQYIAFYQYLKEEFKADAIIHVGTHGTLEFLKGKEAGMSGDCFPNSLLYDIPHMYIYYCGNPAEATIAKRRSNANLISYQPPVFIPGALYGQYSKLMTSIDNYHQALAISPENSKNVLDETISLANSLGFSEDLEEIERELYRMKMSLIPKGLHIFGKGYSNEERIEYVQGLLRYSFNETDSLRLLIAKEEGLDLEEIYKTNDYKTLERMDTKSNEIIEKYLNGELMNPPIHLKPTLEYGKKVADCSKENHEIQGLLRTLKGEYNQAKLAGDIYRHASILPTGYNLYQFDSRLIPTVTAYKRGKKIAEKTIEAYFNEHKAYPASTAVVLWGLETSRTQGETFSQILAYLGVKVSEKSSEWDPIYEIIPLEQLSRPRIDITINICGFFRDMFPNLIESLNDVFLKISDLEEPYEKNYFKMNSQRLYKKLLGDGYDEETAKELSVSRIFGPGEGEYGTGITKLFETKNWENEEQIGNMFLGSLNHVYNRNMHGKPVDGLLEENLKSVDLVSQIRSSHEYEITDLDHYYEYFGGLSKSVEMVKGKKVKMYITDTTTDRILSESIEKAIGRGIRTRVTNPKWIDGMLEHKYHGVQKIADRFENIMGLAASTNSVENWIYDDLESTYVEDELLRKRMIENNPHAFMDILEQMMEYYERGYWEASEEQLNRIKNTYIELENKVEESI